MAKELSELDLNIYTLNYMIEDHGDLVGVAIEKIIDTIIVLRKENLELALKLSQVFENESFWEKTKNWALQNYLESQEM